MFNLLFSQYRVAEAWAARKNPKHKSIFSARELSLMVEELNQRIAKMPERLRKLFNL